MNVETTRFGRIEVPEEKIIDFPEGLIGFSQLKKFVVIQHKKSLTMYWLQSLEKADMAFLMMFPFNMIPDYAPRLSGSDCEHLQLSNGDIAKAEIYTFTVVPENPQDMSVNLLSPIVINPDAGLGRQIVLDDSRYSVAFKIIREIHKKLEENKAQQKNNAHTQEKKE